MSTHTSSATLDPTLLDQYGPLVAAVLPSAMGMYSPGDVIDRALAASAALEEWLDDRDDLDDPAAHLALLAVLLERAETSGLMAPARLLAFVRTAIGL